MSAPRPSGMEDLSAPRPSGMEDLSAPRPAGKEDISAARPASVAPSTEPPPSSGAPFLLGGVGLAAFLMGFLLAVGGRSNFQQLAGLISLVVGSVLLVGGFIVAAIERVREDSWRERVRRDRR